MQPCEHFASVNIDGVYYPLGIGARRIGDLVFSIELESKAEGLYSWLVNVENDSDESSPRIRELFGLDITLGVRGAAVLNTLRGDDCTIRSFFPESFALSDNTKVIREPLGGRSSNTTAFPYFDIKDESDGGLVFGIGWSGAWRMIAERHSDELRLCAGFAECDFILNPHERVRSVRILAYLGKGSTDKLRQDFVRLHRAHYSTSERLGDFFPIAGQAFDRYYWGNAPKNGETHFWENDSLQKRLIDSAERCKYFNSFWIDACWFDGAFRSGVGNYRYSDGFPEGLRSIGERAHEKGMRFILWFEPVRCHTNTEVYNRFSSDSSKIISLDGEDDILVNIGDSEVWQYQFDNISKIIEENGVDIYRQDFNIDPHEYLKTLDTPDRIGMAEIRFVEALYRLWDSLSERFPGLLIDNCASGGRLIDVETMMRSVPLWRSDMACRPSPAAMQNEILTLSRYIPYHSGGSFDYSAYFMRSSMTFGIACELAFLGDTVDPKREENSLRAVSDESFMISEVKNRGIDFSAVEKQLRELLEIKEYWYGDFTALTPPAESLDVTVAYALTKREGEGIAVILRRENAPEHFTLRLPGIDPDAEYTLMLSDEGLEKSQRVVSGKALVYGIDLRVATAPGSLLIHYSKK